MPDLKPAPTLVTMKDHDEGVAAVEAGKVDAYASDQVILIGEGYKAKDPKSLEVPDISLSYEPYGIMLRQGDDDLRLIADRELAKLYRSGEVMKVYDRWLRPLIGEPIPILKSMYVLYALPE
jgi:ABC-type amino acid transport substrate-binding protein